MLTEIEKSDIRVQYAQAADRRKQIIILSELYACSKEEILDTIGLASEKDAPTKPAFGTSKYSKEIQSRVIEAVIAQGLTNRQAASKFDVAISVVGKWISAYRKEHGIPYVVKAGKKLNQKQSFVNEEFDALFSADKANKKEQATVVTTHCSSMKETLSNNADDFEKSLNSLMDAFYWMEDIFPAPEELKELLIEHFANINGFVKGIRWAASYDFNTKDIVEELSRREGVEKIIVPAYEDVSVSVNGPAIILKIID